MTNEIMDKALDRVASDVHGLIEEHRKAIKKAMCEQMIVTAENDPDGKLEFSLTMGSKITPENEQAVVATTLAWSVKVKKSTNSLVDDHPELPLEDGVEVSLEVAGKKPVTFRRKS
jgi:hypothetical protein